MTDWKSRFSAFSAALKKGKAPVDLEVENALLKRALGYDYEETVTEVYDDQNGVQRKHVRRIKKHMPSDPASMFFWLKNRRPDRWREKPESTGGDDEPLKKLLEEWDHASERKTT